MDSASRNAIIDGLAVLAEIIRLSKTHPTDPEVNAPAQPVGAPAQPAGAPAQPAGAPVQPVAALSAIDIAAGAALPAEAAPPAEVALPVEAVPPAEATPAAGPAGADPSESALEGPALSDSGPKLRKLGVYDKLYTELEEDYCSEILTEALQRLQRCNVLSGCSMPLKDSARLLSTIASAYLDYVGSNILPLPWTFGLDDTLSRTEPPCCKGVVTPVSTILYGNRICNNVQFRASFAQHHRDLSEFDHDGHGLCAAGHWIMAVLTNICSRMAAQNELFGKNDCIPTYYVLGVGRHRGELGAHALAAHLEAFHGQKAVAYQVGSSVELRCGPRVVRLVNPSLENISEVLASLRLGSEAVAWSNGRIEMTEMGALALYRGVNVMPMSDVAPDTLFHLDEALRMGFGLYIPGADWGQVERVLEQGGTVGGFSLARLPCPEELPAGEREAGAVLFGGVVSVQRGSRSFPETVFGSDAPGAPGAAQGYRATPVRFDLDLALMAIYGVDSDWITGSAWERILSNSELDPYKAHADSLDVFEMRLKNLTFPRVYDNGIEEFNPEHRGFRPFVPYSAKDDIARALADRIIECQHGTFAELVLALKCIPQFELKILISALVGNVCGYHDIVPQKEGCGGAEATRNAVMAAVEAMLRAREKEAASPRDRPANHGACDIQVARWLGHEYVLWG